MKCRKDPPIVSEAAKARYQVYVII